MKALHCFKVYRPDQNGGIEEAIAGLSAGSARHFDTSILVCRTLGLGSNIVLDGIPVERTSTFGQISSVPLSPTYLFKLRRRMRDADIVVFHAPFPLIDIGIWFGMRADQAVIIHWHAEIVGRDAIQPLVRPLQINSVRRADCVIVSDRIVADSSPVLSRFSEKCVAIPYGLDTKDWMTLTAADLEEIARLRAKHPRLVAACGRLVSYKGFDVLINSMKRIDAHLIIVGMGPLEARLKSLASELGLSDRVTLAGFVPRSRQKQIFHAASVFAMPSTTKAEAFGIAQVEAMCCATPVVNTSLPTGVPNVARHMQEGLTVRPQDPVELAQAINTLLDDPDLAQRLGQAGKTRAAAMYDRATNIAASIAVYQHALAERRSAPRSALDRAS